MSAAGRVGMAATGAATSILVARLLGPDGSGTYFVAQSVVVILTILSTLGTEHGIAYFVSTGAWAPRRALDAALKMAFSLGLLGAAAALALRAVAPSAFAGLPMWLTAVVVAGVPFGLVWFYASYVALATDRYEPYVLLPLAHAFLAMCLAGAGAALFEVSGAIVGTTLAGVAIAAAALLWQRAHLPREAAEAGRGQLRRAVSFGVKGYAANALQLLNYRLDVFVLAAAASSAAVGHYSVAVAVTSVLWLLPGAIAGVLFPRIAYLKAQSDAEARRHLAFVEAKALRHATIAVGVGAGALALVLLFLVVPVYGPGFRPAIVPGLILLPGAMAIGITGVLSSSIVGRGKPAYSLYTVLVTMPVTLVFYATLIPWLETEGAALGSTLSYVLTLLITARFYRRLTSHGVGRLLLPTRSEVADILAVPGAARAWARSLRR